MRNYNVLIEKPSGFVSYCDCCHTFQFVFGNIALVKSEEEYQELIQTFTDICQYHRSRGSGHEKSIWLDTSLSGVRFVFSYHEVKAMYNLAEQAYLIYRAEQLVNE